MYRFLLKLEYDGTCFHGWQIQDNIETVQGVLLEAIRNLEPSCQEVVGAGRTDAGVHATNQIAHIDLEKLWEEYTVQKALNFYLAKKPISVLEVKLVDMNFHARFSAIKRHYIYKIYYRGASLTFERNLYWNIHYPLNEEEMKVAASYLVGKHDFTTFRSSSCQAKSPVKTIDAISIKKNKSDQGFIYEFQFSARSFLHNQIRSIVGSLEKVGKGSWLPERIAQALKAKDRSNCGTVAPPQGLYLSGIEYD